jgi:hypothetical protein
MQTLGSVFIQNIKKYVFFCENVFKYILIVIFSSSTFFSISSSLHYFSPFRNIPCTTFTIWCNKHNQHFIVTHITYPFCCSTYSLLAILLVEILCPFNISLPYILLIRFLSPPFRTAHFHTVFHCYWYSEFTIVKEFRERGVDLACTSLYYCS